MPPPRFNHGDYNDVFISYAWVDNKPDPAGRSWVSSFENDLKQRLEQVSGRSIQVWRDDRLGAADRFTQEIHEQLTRSAVLVTVVSPSYVSSDWCTDELEKFVAACGARLFVGNKARIVKVAKTHVDRERYRKPLGELLEYRFFLELRDRTFREFLLHEDPGVQRHYVTRVDDVANEIARILERLERGANTLPTKGALYVAESSGDIENHRDQLKRSLVQHGFEVLPGRMLPRDAPSIRTFVSEEICRSRLTVHPVGARYGIVPELADGKSLARLQLECAASVENGLRKLIWIPQGLQPEEEPQMDFLRDIRKTFPQQGFEVLEVAYHELETHLLKDRIDANGKSQKPTSSRTTKHIYLICDRNDRESARVARRYLLGLGFEVDWLPESREPRELLDIHHEYLREDDAVLVFYGNTTDLWVDRQRSDIRKAPGLGRRIPMRSKLLLSEPESADKLDLRMHPNLALDGLPPRTIEEALQPFVAELTLS